MGDMSEPSMEEILSSIKRIIAEDGDGADRSSARARRLAREDRATQDRVSASTAPAGGVDVLELTSDLMDDADDVSAFVVDEAPVAAPVTAAPVEVAPAAEVAPLSAPASAAVPSVDAPVVSADAVAAARQSLSQLSSMLIRPTDAPSNTLEGMVQDMLRPMLKDWLDANLPDIVERKVAQEIARISGRVS